MSDEQKFAKMLVAEALLKRAAQEALDAEALRAQQKADAAAKERERRAAELSRRLRVLRVHGVRCAGIGAATCVLLWLYGPVIGRPTASKHEPTDTYIPDVSSLVIATIVALALSLAAVFVVETYVGRGADSWWIGGFVVGVVFFLTRLPWSSLDRYAGEMFSVAMWFVPPLVAALCYAVSALRTRVRSGMDTDG